MTYIDDFSSINTSNRSNDLYIDNLGTQDKPIEKLRVVIIGRAFKYREWWPSEDVYGQPWEGLKDGEVFKKRSYAFDGEHSIPVHFIETQTKTNADGETYVVENMGDVYVFTVYTPEGEVKVWKISKPALIKPIKEESKKYKGQINGMDIVASRSGKGFQTRYNVVCLGRVDDELIAEAQKKIEEIGIDLEKMFDPQVINGKLPKPTLNLPDKTDEIMEEFDIFLKEEKTA